jgi:hypothetical protein
LQAVRASSFPPLDARGWVAHAYKDLSLVVEACDGAGISKKVVKFRPLGVVKG